MQYIQYIYIYIYINIYIIYIHIIYIHTYIYIYIYTHQKYREDIVKTNADQGGAVVILDLKHYIKESEG